MGHDAPFAFDLDYRPGPGHRPNACRTPPVLSLSALDAALDVWDGVDMALVRARSIALSDLFIAEVETRCAGHGLELASPRKGRERGSQVSFHCPNGYAVMQALIARNVIGDFRAPDVIRFGFAPLYNTEDEIVRAARCLALVLSERLWDNPAFTTRAKVT